MVFLWLMHWSHLATLEFDNIFAAVPEVNGVFCPRLGGGDVHCAPVFLAEPPPDRDSWNTLIALCCDWTHLSHFEMCAVDKKLCVYQSCICYYVSEWGK